MILIIISVTIIITIIKFIKKIEKKITMRWMKSKCLLKTPGSTIF